MIKNEDGSVVLTKEELEELNNAYKKLYDMLSIFPASLQDYCKDNEEYANIGKWQCLLNGEEFDRSDWIGEEEEEEEQ